MSRVSGRIRQDRIEAPGINGVVCQFSAYRKAGPSIESFEMVLSEAS